MKIERKKVSMQVFDQIKKMIKEEKLKPGDRLPPESHFTELFGVSRTPIREALSVLEASGLIASKQGGGSVIQSIQASNLMEEMHFEFLDPQDVIHLLETRIVLESGAAYYAADRRSEEDLIAIMKAYQGVIAQQTQGEVGHKEDVAFHQSIVKAAHNPVLEQSMQSVSTLYEKAVEYSLAKNIGWEEKRTQVHSEHESIMHFIENKRPDDAFTAMKNHLMNAKRKLENRNTL
ncbi:FadR/GntR family transcriptional regulator [Shouchella shacheensis]|uniref:FadR/GntR family transcriptional regulator n=1 Tax=Shouchella shacheensis TaxID=1649580 RepID=UPI0009ECA4EB|nr:FadR/GntR family transcriptional regulator [Shouchella shacheensis]